MDEKKSIDELCALYDLEPFVADIYVEGNRDKCFVEWFLSRQQLKGVNVYSIDVIDVPNHLLTKYGLSLHSNRSRVVALSAELYSRLQTKVKVMCVADRDFEDVLPGIPSLPLLCLTDGTSIEMYAFNEVCLHKLTTVVLGGFPLTSAEMLKCLASILRDIYAIRLANEKLGWNMQWLCFTRYVSIAGTRVQFDRDAFVKAYLLKNSKWNRKTEFHNVLSECKSLLSFDAPRSARSHDLGDLLLYMIRHLRKERRFGNTETLEGVLLGTVETCELVRFPLFRKIKEFAVANKPLEATR